MITAPARPKQNHGDQADPAAYGMHHDRAGKIVESCSETLLEPSLNAEILVPCNPLEKRVHEPDQQKRSGYLRIEFRAFRYPAGHDSGNRGCESEQEEKLDQLIAVVLSQMCRPVEELDAVGDVIADKKIGYGRHGEIRQDLYQGVNLILAANGAEFEKREAGVHCKHHDRAE